MATSIRAGITGRLAERATNATQPTDPTPAGYTRWDDAGNVVESRALLPSEAAALASLDAQSTVENNRTTLQQQAVAAMTGNRTYINLASPSAAQTTAEVKALAQQMNGLIRLVLGQLDATN